MKEYILQVDLPHVTKNKGVSINNITDEVIIDNERATPWLEAFCLEFRNNKSILKPVDPEDDLRKKLKLTKEDWMKLKIYIGGNNG